MAALMGETVLALNCGSSSLKFGLYEDKGNAPIALIEGQAEEVGSPKASFWCLEKGGERIQDSKAAELSTHEAALQKVLTTLKRFPTPRAVGHRFVHGGPHLTSHKLLDGEVERALQQAVEYAPLHMPPALRVLKATAEALPQTPQAICLDTAFHQSMPDVGHTYALPKAVRERGVRRYGFHGLSLESILRQLDPLPERLVVAHLGNGASVTAIFKGKSIDTTMGLTPTGGIVMGTRCGDLDPGVSVYLQRHGYVAADDLEDLFDHQAGLRGLSNGISDVRELTKRRAKDSEADLALRVFCYSAKKAIASMAAALSGIDCLIFTGGIGEHAEDLRHEILDGLQFLGEGLSVKVVPSQEDEQIVRNTLALIRNGAAA
jgi:acetate kinase